jgi:ABC-2 type transport system ATP-binding protein
LSKSFGDVRALCDVDIDVARGTVLGLLGPNGAGKTTFVRILTTLLEPDGGTAAVAGLDVVRDAANLREQIGLAGQYAAVDENLTGLENLTMVGRLYGMPRRTARERGEALLKRFDLVDAARRPVKTYSGGMRVGSTLPPRSSQSRPSCSSTSPRPASIPAAGSHCGT